LSQLAKRVNKGSYIVTTCKTCQQGYSYCHNSQNVSTKVAILSQLIKHVFNNNMLLSLIAFLLITSIKLLKNTK